MITPLLHQKPAAYISTAVEDRHAPRWPTASDGGDAEQALGAPQLVDGVRGALRLPWSSPSPVAVKKVDCVFLWRDTGDAQNLLPVAEALIEAGMAVRVVVLGHAAKKVATDAPALRGRVLWPDTIRGVASKLGDRADDLGGGAGHRARFREDEDAARIAALFDTPVVVTGVVSRAQRNLCVAFKSKAKPPRVVGYVDSLAMNPSSMFYRRSAKMSRFEQAHGDTSSARVKRDPYSVSAFGAILDTVWAPFSASVSDIAAKAGLPMAHIEAVGHPGTERVLTQLAQRQTRGERVEVRRKVIGEASGRLLIFYAGGRKTDTINTYRRSFHAFVAGVIEAASKYRTRPIKVVVGLHPASDGADEMDVIRELSAEHVVEVDKAHVWATDDLLLASDVVMAWNSTVASQAALFEGVLRKQVCFVDVAQEPDLPLVVPAGLATQARTSGAVTDFLAKALEPHASPNCAVALPTDAARRMADAIIETARKKIKETTEGRYALPQEILAFTSLPSTAEAGEGKYLERQDEPAYAPLRPVTMH